MELQIQHDAAPDNKNDIKTAMIGVLFDTSRYDESVTAGQVAIIDSFFSSLDWDKLDIDTTGT